MSNEFELYYGGDKQYDQEELNKMFKTTNLDFLKTNNVRVLNRKFKVIGTLNTIAARALTDDPPIKSLYNNTNVGVLSDFKKSASPPIVMKDIAKDRTYLNARDKIYASQDEELSSTVTFKPDTDFNLRFSRLNQEQALKANIGGYFGERESIRVLENRIFLQEYGLSPDEVDEIMARSKVEDALKAMKDPKRSTIGKSTQFERMINNVVGSMSQQPSLIDSDLTRTIVNPLPSPTFSSPRAGRRIALTQEQYTKSAEFQEDVSRNINKTPNTIDLSVEKMKLMVKLYNPELKNIGQLKKSDLQNLVSRDLAST